MAAVPVKRSYLWFVVAGVTGLIFIADLLTPRGVGEWILYIVPMGFTFWTRGRRSPLILAAVITILLAIGLILSPQGVPLPLAAVNRVVVLIAVWGIALAVMRSWNAEALLRDIHQRIMLATEATGVAIWEWNLTTNQVHWDRQMFAIYGIEPTPDGMVDYGVWSSAVLPDDLPRQEEILRETVARRGRSVREFRIRRPDGSVRIIQAVEVVRTDSAGAPQWVIGTNQDITERRRGEEELRRSEARHQSLLAGLPELVFLIDRDLRYRDYHASQPEQLYVAPDQFLGRRIDEVLPQPVAQVAGAAVASVFESRTPRTFQFELPLPSGSRQFEAVVVPMDQDRVTTVVRDITQRRTLENQLRQAQKMEAVGELTGGIAHDFNNILTIIGSNAELISARLSADSAVAEYLADLRSAVRRGADMIAQLLKFSRRGMLERRPMNPSAVIRDFSGMLRRLLPETVSLEIEAATDDTVLIDPGAVQQVIVNLCTNARDAMPEGGVLRIACRTAWLDEGYHATHPWVRPGPYVCIDVEDAGAGMDQETQLRVFEPFFTTKPVGTGTGLGMAMVYGIMKEHEGMVQVYSEKGRGTTVKLYFPVVSAAAVAEARRHTDPGRIRGGNETILVVEDDAAIRRAARRALEGKGYTVVEAGDGEEALNIFRRDGRNISLIVSDLVMPKLGGRQLADALREMGSTVPLLFTSGYSADSTYRAAELPPGVAFLHKPWTLTDLFDKVREMLDQRIT